MQNKKIQNIILSIVLIIIITLIFTADAKSVSRKNESIFFESTPKRARVFSNEKFLGETPFKMKYNRSNHEFFFCKNTFYFKKEFFVTKHVSFSYNYSNFESQSKNADTVRVDLKLDKRSLKGYNNDFLSQKLRIEDLLDKTSEELAFMRNEIYAKYGREFITPKYRDYFSSKKWYKINPHFSDDFLNETDKENVSLILSLEKPSKDHKTLTEKNTDKPKYTYIEYKDNEFDLTKLKLSLENIVFKTKEELALLRNEIYAKHGREFKNPKYKEYFSSKEWYKINHEYSDDLLTEKDKENIALILDVEKSNDKSKTLMKKILDNPEYTYKDEKLIFIDERHVKYLKSTNWGRIFCLYDYISPTGGGEDIINWNLYKDKIYLSTYNKLFGYQEMQQVAVLKPDFKNNTFILLEISDEIPETQTFY